MLTRCLKYLRMVEIHNLQVWLLTSHYIYHSMALRLKEVKVYMAVLILFGACTTKSCKMCLLGSPVCINNLTTDEWIILKFDIEEF